MTTTGEVIKQEKVVKEGSCWGIASPVCPWGSSQKGPLIPQHELSFAIQIRLRSERPRQRKQLARSAVQEILYNQSHVFFFFFFFNFHLP